MPSTPDPTTGTGPREAGTRAILDALLDGDPAQSLDFDTLLDGLGRRAFGMLLFVAALPAFIPIPIGGALSGPLIMLVAAQLLVAMQHPWLPGFIARRGPKRQSLARFERLVDPWLARLERIVRPRFTAVLDHPLATAFTGLLLLLLGLLLALPIPLTNYVFGGLILLYALALLERDGALMLAAWGLGMVALVTTGALSGGLITALQAWIETTF
ncbi:exopolysaccharide biosynthesis protein [Thermomonas carbonis]|uniref:Exopolysaccharide biosynthesis protein n=1 Tax=Thermomonas carbonis TaxID=1463158 RepID=A0A7G9SQU0_9GAMM|nr:exopolysaccharide biosynthesis protein [Thermomonas carbonis]QNN70215.1 exopolysaccharide biosynthesis protein [Thermomonas carbonis]GHB98538.1 exod protein [Thermomonas carbonis]